ISGFAISHSPSGTIQLHVPRPMPNSTTPHHVGHGLKRSLGWLVRNRRLVRDCERLTATSEAMIEFAMIRMLVRLSGQSSRWSHEPHRKTAPAKTVEDLIAA
ncbi:hypothetical protein PV440_41480, partial [Streptomyces sp. ME02-6985-2c]|nr:hypothetical protein [Streptomyces sp. ME02-6985-2c]